MFDYFSKNLPKIVIFKAQNGSKLLKFPKNIPFLLVPLIDHLVALCSTSHSPSSTAAIILWCWSGLLLRLILLLHRFQLLLFSDCLNSLKQRRFWRQFRQQFGGLFIGLSKFSTDIPFIFIWCCQGCRCCCGCRIGIRRLTLLIFQLVFSCKLKLKE